MRKPLAISLFFCLTLSSVPLLAQTKPATPPTTPAPAAAPASPTTPAEFFARARQLSDLEAAGIPFHLKATFVATGGAALKGDGTYEEWWQSKNLWRKEATLGNFRSVTFKNGTNRPTTYTSGEYIPLRLRQAWNSILIRIPADMATKSTWKIGATKIANLRFVTASSEHLCQTPGPNWPKKKKLNDQKCLNDWYFTENGIPRIRIDGATTIVFNVFRPFANRLIPNNIQESDASGAEILNISIASLEPLTTMEIPNNTGENAVPGLRPFLDADVMKAIHSGDNPQPSKLIWQIKPKYPYAAMQRHIQGTVVITTTIDEEGNVREPYIVHSAGHILDTAGLAAVRQWKYRPATLNGKPLQIQTSIAVVFKMDN